MGVQRFNVYRTSDGKEHDSKRLAIVHERLLSADAHLENILNEYGVDRSLAKSIAERTPGIFRELKNIYAGKKPNP